MLCRVLFELPLQPHRISEASREQEPPARNVLRGLRSAQGSACWVLHCACQALEKLQQKCLGDSEFDENCNPAIYYLSKGYAHTHVHMRARVELRVAHSRESCQGAAAAPKQTTLTAHTAPARCNPLGDPHQAKREALGFSQSSVPLLCLFQALCYIKRVTVSLF